MGWQRPRPSLDRHRLSRYVTGGACAVGSGTLPQGSLYAPAGNGVALLETGWFTNNSTNDKVIQLNRLNSTGTQGASMGTPGKYDNDTVAAAAGGFLTHSVGPTLGGILDFISTGSYANSSGDGDFWFSYDVPLEIPAGTANGVGWLPITGAAGQADVHFVWEE